LSYALDMLLGLGATTLEWQTLHSSAPFLCIFSRQPGPAEPQTAPARDMYHSIAVTCNGFPAHTCKKKSCVLAQKWILTKVALQWTYRTRSNFKANLSPRQQLANPRRIIKPLKMTLRQLTHYQMQSSRVRLPTPLDHRARLLETGSEVAGMSWTTKRFNERVPATVPRRSWDRRAGSSPSWAPGTGRIWHCRLGAVGLLRLRSRQARERLRGSPAGGWRCEISRSGEAGGSREGRCERGDAGEGSQEKAGAADLRLFVFVLGSW
jgi:hypothetical protein